MPYVAFTVRRISELPDSRLQVAATATPQSPSTSTGASASTGTGTSTRTTNAFTSTDTSSPASTDIPDAALLGASPAVAGWVAGLAALVALVF